MVLIPDIIPEHRLLSDSESKKVCEKYKTRLEDFPKILESDPQARALNAKPGQLVEIKRKENETTYLYYRYVIKDITYENLKD
ncbi:MAG: DNA-directed RNA polymerase subunit RpoH/Rpb5 C-terminal domain-containing protein [Candidatus Micrarchaeia archaeon]